MALINALVLVAGLSAIAVSLMLRANEARERIAGMFEAGQTEVYLDAAQALGQNLLSRAPGEPEITHTGQGWAQGYANEPIDRGMVSLQISDLQGRFNLAWLAPPPDDPDSELIRAIALDALSRLAQEIGLSANARRRLVQALDPDLGQRVTAWGRVTRPPPLPLVAVEQLRLIEGLDPADYERLRPFVAALPDQTFLNLNTVSAEVLAAFLPRTGVATLSRALDVVRPFEDYTDAVEWVEANFGPDARSQIELLGVDLTSEWFEFRLDARLDSLRLKRKVVVRRDDPSACCTVILSIPEPD
ncbi:MAG: type II secretion system minor pseudopilin GspK [Roseinatronobacter sp.]